MKFHLLAMVLFISAAILEVDAAENSSLSEGLQPIGNLIGTWEFSMTDSNATQHRGKYRFEAAALGHAIVTRMHPGETDDRTLQSGLFYFDSATERIVFMNIMGEGYRSISIYPKGSLSKEYSCPSTVYTPDGKKGTYVAHVKWDGNDSFSYWETDIQIEGVKQPEQGKISFRRIKE